MVAFVRSPSEFVPVTADETAITVVAAIGSIVAYLFLMRVYRWYPLRVALVGTMISWVPVQLLAWRFEGRHMWLPGQHSAVFFWGDLIALPVIAMAFAAMGRQWRDDHPDESVPLAERRQWLTVVFVGALIISYAYHSSQLDTWSYSGVHSPSKAWHDFFMYPVFLFFLVSPVPYLWQTSWRRHRVALPVLLAGAVAGVAVWFVLGHVYDPAHVMDHLPLLRFT